MPVIVEEKSTSNELPRTLRPYVQHGMDFLGSGKERVSDCPFCGRSGKFSVSVETGQWRCLVCGGGLEKGGGGHVDFIRLLWDVSDKATTSRDYEALAKELGLQFPDTVMHWRIAKSALSGEWLIPGWSLGADGKPAFSQLYRYAKVPGEDRMACIATADRKHTLIGLNLFDPNCEEIHVCEGWKDGLAWWEALRSTKIDAEGSLFATSAVDQSLAHGVCVVAASTCTAFPASAAFTPKQLAGKTVSFLYDNDYPRKNSKTGELITPMVRPGFDGMKRDTLKVPGAKTVQFLNWGEEGHDSSLPDGCDLRDLLNGDRYNGIAHVLNRLEEVPTEWRVKSTLTDSSVQIVPKFCDSWKMLTQSWRGAMKWTQGLDHALAGMLAAVTSTNSLGDQLWLKIIGPASCGKSTLCEALSVNKRYVYSKSTIRGFHSGYKDAGSTEDNSLIPKIKGKTFVIKDGDTLLQSPNLEQILAEARDIYDCVSRTHYRNNMGKDYEGIRSTFLLCGTSSLRKIDSSELGERFLDVVIMQKIDDDLEDEILWRKVNQAERQVGIEANCEITSHYAPELLKAMELTAGYIDWLRENTSVKISTIVMDEWTKRQVVHIAKFVAFMRARPSKHQKENHERELAARLVSVHTRLAKCLALVLNQPAVNETVLDRVRQIGMDTGRGNSLEIVRLIYEQGRTGMDQKALHVHTNMDDKELYNLLRFMRGIGILLYQKDSTTSARAAWRLTPRFRDLYEEVMNYKQDVLVDDFDEEDSL